MMNDEIKTIPYGVSDFAEMRRRSGYYVDNTWGIPLLEALPYLEVKYIKKSDNVTEATKTALLAEARTQLEQYADDNHLAEDWHLKPNGTVTLIRLAIVFHGEELLLAEEI